MKESGLAPEGWVAVDRANLMTPFPDVYAVGDCVAIPMAKAGVFAENAAGVVADGIAARLRGEELGRRYEGEGNCYIEFGGGRVAKIEANFLGGPAPTAQLEDGRLLVADDQAFVGPQNRVLLVDEKRGLAHPVANNASRFSILPAERTKVLSTGGMVKEAERSSASKFLVATETGILHQLRKGSPGKVFEPINEYAVCQYMKAITPEKLLRSLHEGVFEITVPEDVRVRAAQAVGRMIAITPDAVPVA